MIISTKIDELKEMKRGVWDESGKENVHLDNFLMRKICREDQHGCRHRYHYFALNLETQFVSIYQTSTAFDLRQKFGC